MSLSLLLVDDVVIKFFFLLIVYNICWSIDFIFCKYRVYRQQCVKMARILFVTCTFVNFLEHVKTSFPD